ncbi:hypothetical protein IGK16_002320 [Enterococcus pernyi]
MKRKKLLGVLATLTVCSAAVISYPKDSFAIYLEDFNGVNLRQKLIDEGKTAYVDGIFQKEVKKQNYELTSNKAGTELTFTFSVPTWTSVTAGRGEWIERIAGNGQTITGPGTGVPGYDKMYYGDGPDQSGTFTVDTLSISTTDESLADLLISSSIDKSKHELIVSTTIKLKKDVNITSIPLNYSAKDIVMGTTVVDSTKSSPYNVDLPVADINLANSKTKATLDLGTVNVAVKADTTTSSSTTPSTSTSSSTTPSTSTSSSTTPSTSTSSSTTPSTSTSSSTTPSTSTSTSSTTTATSSVTSTEPSTSTNSSVPPSQAKTPVLYTASGSSSSSSSSTMPTTSTSAKISSTASASTLPKTGEKQSIWITLMGIVLLGASMFYFKKNKVKNK